MAKNSGLAYLGGLQPTDARNAEAPVVATGCIRKCKCSTMRKDPGFLPPMKSRVCLFNGIAWAMPTVVVHDVCCSRELVT